MSLNISPTLELPVEFLSLRKVVYGGSGAGKTSLGRVIYEEATAAGVPCGAIDLKGDWWGLKSSKTGKSEGLPVVIFGGEHADVPIVPEGGSELAEMVAELRQPFVVDLEEFSKAKQLKFLAGFFDRLYDKNREALVLQCDEADRYIPQRIITKDPNAAICLGAGEDIAKRGRKHGIFPIFFSQRNADLNKSVTELCDVAIVFRTAGPNDQKAVNDWFLAKGNLVTEEQRREVMDNIASLANGEAIICSAHPHMPLFKRVRIRLPNTFDSSATPEIGKQLIQPTKLARIELSALNERMKATIENAKANAPETLKRRISDLERQVATATAKPANLPAPEPKIKEVAVVTKEDIALLEDNLRVTNEVSEELREMAGKLTEFWPTLRIMRERLDAIKSANIIIPSNAHPPRLVVSQRHDPKSFVADNSTTLDRGTTTRPRDLYAEADTGEWMNNGKPGKPSKCATAIMTALLQYAPKALKRNRIALLSGYSVTSSTFDNGMSECRTNGCLAGSGDSITATPKAAGIFLNWTPLPTGKAMRDYWINKVGVNSCPGKLLAKLIELYPHTISRDDLGAETGYSPTSSTFDNALSTLRTLEMITRDREPAAHPDLFLE